MKNSVFLTMCLYLCVLLQVSALCFTSANISLFERLSLRKDSDSAHIILWDEVVKGRYRSCYTIVHQGHTPAWVRKGGHTHNLFLFVLSCIMHINLFDDSLINPYSLFTFAMFWEHFCDNLSFPYLLVQEFKYCPLLQYSNFHTVG